MALAKKIFVALFLAAALIFGLGLLSHVMHQRMEYYMRTGEYIDLPNRIAFGIVFFWDRFRFLMAPLIIIWLVGAAIAQHSLFSKR